MKAEIKGSPLVLLFIILPWLMGAVLAKGFWSTLAAIGFPPWAWYLVIERAMQLSGMTQGCP